jgi:hypothetical protein
MNGIIKHDKPSNLNKGLHGWHQLIHINNSLRNNMPEHRNAAKRILDRKP